MRWGARDVLRGTAIRFLSMRKIGVAPSPGIRVICYHGVEAHEVSCLERQLEFMGRVGQFISIDDAVGIMESGAEIRDPLFSITFDDGLSSTYVNAWPIFEQRNLPFSVFVITGSVGDDGYMNWEDIRRMAGSKTCTIGSHTVNHRNLAMLSLSEVERELAESKLTLEAATGMLCDHFCCPWGRPGRDFDIMRDPAIAVEVGYRSFLTTERGFTRTGDQLPMVKRDVLHMHSSDAELRHFLI